MDQSYKNKDATGSAKREIPEQLDRLDNKLEYAGELLSELVNTLANVLPNDAKASGGNLDKDFPPSFTVYGDRLEKANHKLSVFNEALQTIISNVQV